MFATRISAFIASAQLTLLTSSPSRRTLKGGVGKAPTDPLGGAGSPGNGNALAATELKVEVKLADLQADPDNPLYSAKTFEELQLSEAPSTKPEKTQPRHRLRKESLFFCGPQIHQDTKRSLCWAPLEALRSTKCFMDRSVKSMGPAKVTGHATLISRSTTRTCTKSLKDKTGETNVYMRGLLPETTDEMLHACDRLGKWIECEKAILSVVRVRLIIMREECFILRYNEACNCTQFTKLP